MGKTFLNSLEINTCNNLPAVGSIAPDFELVKTDLSDIHLSGFKGKRIVLNIFPSLDTEVCARSVRKFNEAASKLENTVVLCISKDLPFAAQRFCSANGIENVIIASAFRSDFGTKYGVEMTNGPLWGLFARTIIIIDSEGKIIATSLSKEITDEPDYELINKI